MMNNVLQLFISALFPVLASIVFLLLEKCKFYKNIPYFAKQIIIGVVFAGIAIIGTEWGVPVNGAQANARDAAPLVAGLFFSGPAGIIAGVVGGVERWFATLWGVGSYTRIACSVSTLVAGFYGAFLRRYLLDRKKPSWIIALFCGVSMEIFHLFMVFITHIDNAEKAVEVVSACTLPMVSANGLSLLIIAMLFSLAKNNWKIIINRQSNKSILTKMQKSLFVTIMIIYFLVSVFMVVLESNLSYSQAEVQLKNVAIEVVESIGDASDSNMLFLASLVAQEVENGNTNFEELAEKYNLYSINFVDENGIVAQSNEESFVGFDMHGGDQSRQFLCLLNGTKEFVQKFGPIAMDQSILRKFAGVAVSNGFIQVGYDVDAFQNQIYEEVQLIASNRHIGKNGVVLVLDNNERIISNTKLFDKGDVPEYRVLGDGVIKEGSVAKIEVGEDNEEYYCIYYSAEGYKVIALNSVKDANIMGDISIYVMVFSLIFGFTILFIVVYLLIKKSVLKPIVAMTKSLARIVSGNLSEEVDVRNNAEFDSLSNDINSTVATLKDYIAQAEARIDEELEFARTIQLSALPNSVNAFPSRKEFEVYARMDTAKEVGGDFYDFYFSDKDRFNFIVADVSGKGIPAALFMMRAKSVLRSQAESGADINEVFIRSNNALCSGNDAEMFVTAWQGSIDLCTGELSFVNAGHNPPIIRHKNGEFEFYKTRSNLMLGTMEDIPYKKYDLKLEAGDVVYLYTDGVTEATNSNDELYGNSRLLDVLNRSNYNSVQELCDFVKADVDKFVGEAPQFDDITMLAFKYLGYDEKN